MYVVHGDLYLKIGDNKILVNPSSITRRMSDQLNCKITKARIDNSEFKEVPPKEGETKDEYQERLKEWGKEQSKLRKGESAEEFLTRNFEYRAYKDNWGYLNDIVKAIAEVTNQANKFDEESLKDTPTVDINNFIFRVCKVAKIPCEIEEVIVTLAEE